MVIWIWQFEAHLTWNLQIILQAMTLEPWGTPCGYFQVVALNLHSFAKVMPLLEGGSCAYVRDAQVFFRMISDYFLLNWSMKSHILNEVWKNKPVEWYVVY